MTEIEYAKAYNTEFNRINPGVPLNSKWDSIQQMKYLKELLARQQAIGGTAYKIPYVSQTPAPPPVPIPPTPTTPDTPASLLEALSAARYVVKQLEALV